MADYLIQESTLDAIVQAINNKAGTQVSMTPAQMVQAIGNISGGGGVQTATFTIAEDLPSNSTTPVTIMGIAAQAIGTNNYVCFISGGTSTLSNADMGGVFYGGFNFVTPTVTLSDTNKSITFNGVTRIYSEANPRDALQGIYSTLSYNCLAKTGITYTVWGWN